MVSAVEALAKAFARRPVFADVSFALARRVRLHHRPLGLRQDHHPQRAGRAGHGQQRHVFMDGREIAGPSLERGVVFQSHALMPWLTVRQNIAFAVKSRWPDWNRPRSSAPGEVRRAGGPERGHRQEALAALGRHEAARGHRARLRIQPKMLLLDEPFGALDA
jgi:nitrate/nitrite transport system ATP-binding protein